MKIFVIVIICWLSYGTLFAQKDTTKFDMGKRRILIIEQDEITEGANKLQKGKKEFENQIFDLQTKIDSLREKSSKSLNPEEISEYQKQILEFQQQMGALQKGIDQINDDLIALENEKNEQNKKNKSSGTDDLGFDGDWGKFKNKYISKRKLNGNWIGVELGFLFNTNRKFQLTTDENYAKMNSNNFKSFTLNINPLEYNIQIVPRRLGLVTGIGFNRNVYNFDENFVLTIDSTTGILHISEIDQKEYYKNLLITGSATIPLLCEFQWGGLIPKYFFNFGVIGTFTYITKTKQFYKEDKRMVKSKIKEDFNMTPYNLLATVRFGVKKLNFFINWNLISVFVKNNGPEHYPLSFGIHLFNY